jgi:hypothetical protein
MAVAGFVYTINYLRFFYEFPYDTESPYFRHAYLSMVSICFAFYSVLCFFGVRFFCVDTKYRYWFLVFIVVEVSYVLVLVSAVALVKLPIAMSISAAFGVANGGLVIQAVSLFLVWGPAIVFWAHSNQSLQPTAESGG